MKKIVSLLIFNSLLLGLLAQENLSLKKAIEIGLANSYQIEVAKQNLQIAQNNNNWASAGRYPRVDLNLNSRNGYTNAKNPGFLIEQSVLNGGLTPSIDAAWTIFDGKKVQINKQQLEELQNLEITEVELSSENTAQAITLAYYQALIQEEQLKTLQEVLGLSKDRIEYQEIKKEFGQAGKFDLLQTMDAYLNDSTNILIQENNVATAYRNLNLAMGVADLSKRYNLINGLDYEPNTYQYKKLENVLLANNRNLRNLVINQELANINTQFQESFKYPTINLASGLSYDIAGSDGSQVIAFGEQPPFSNKIGGVGKTFNYYFNISANYNLFDAGARKRNIENAKMQEQIAQLSIADLKRTLTSQLQNTLAHYNNQLKLVKLAENLIENARQNLTIAEERFKGGVINSFDYRSIQLAFVSASQVRLNAIFNLKNTETELMQLTGQLLK